MLTQVEAEIDVNGTVSLLEPVKLKKRTRAIVTILEDESQKPDANGKNPEKKGGGLRELFGSVDLGYPTGTDNEAIDAALAEEYAGRR